MSVPDILTAVREVLLGDPDVVALTQGRIWRIQIPPDHARQMPESCVVISRAGGRADVGYLQLSSQRIDVRCYGINGQDAADVASAVHPVLKQLRRQAVGNCMLYSLTVESEKVDLLEANVNWSLVFSSYLALYSEVALMV